ncbi:MAG: DUF1538 domain-containing protein [Ruminococcaceae bacterium]|nr:DUF1538 domain-containing protein [Oscillospiraceae bacterium]
MESLVSVLPITGIVLLLSISFAPMDPGVLALFLFSAIALIVGMALFTLGAGMSMSPLGEGIGVQLSRSKHLLPKLLVCFVLGVLITIAEPDLQVLAEQVPSVPNMVLILSVAIGVGFFIVISLIRTTFRIKLAYLLIGFYVLVLGLAFFAPESFRPTAFDSGGVTTGPITVPFIMALGAGMAAIGSNHHSEDSFGMVSLCSVGPILSVLILSIFYKPDGSASASTPIAEIETTKDAFLEIVRALPHYAQEMLVAFLPIVAVFILFQLFFRRFHGRELPKAIIGFVYTYVGLVLFLTGANVGFMPAGQLIGAELAGSDFKYILIPIGMLIGWFTVAAEPAVHVLKKQVEEISNGTITQKSIAVGLSVGVAFSVGIAMLRVLTGISIMPFMLGGYIISLVISFFVPPLYTGVAFDSGGVASGPMTTTFILPFALGACSALGGNIMTDAFGVVAMVAITPLITIQCIGLAAELRRKSHHRKAAEEFGSLPDTIVYFDDEVTEHE